MIQALKSMTKKTSASASVVDGKLILSFPHAQTPVLWQMDLAQAKSSALEVLKAEKTNTHTLTLKTQKGEQIQVASFETREDALEGLIAASNALKNAHGNIQMVANDDHKNGSSYKSTKKAGKGKWATAIAAIIALVILFGLWGMVAPKSPSSIQTASNNSAANTPSSGATSAAESSGVAVNADDFLNAQ